MYYLWTVKFSIHNSEQTLNIVAQTIIEAIDSAIKDGAKLSKNWRYEDVHSVVRGTSIHSIRMTD